MYFDNVGNVGGVVLDAVLLNMKDNGRISVCGMISQYNKDEPEIVKNLFCLVLECIEMKGFMVFDFWDLYPYFLEATIRRIKEGEIVYVEDIVEGLENAPSALIGLFTGKNIGKQIVLVSCE
ncbi:hypothetical protein AMTRI_Chr06g178700 [Amborella trichopoda]|uniref:Alcohol dehydrogenase-like C-terminal domain-containing protein n=2 Tax=Amborella trichopoda TaxID=13333 RepID=U5DDB8_AMBTC|nr:hypothetical protein AMTR_s00066p00138830 [Amborella trichopoda]